MICLSIYMWVFVKSSRKEWLKRVNPILNNRLKRERNLRMTILRSWALGVEKHLSLMGEELGALKAPTLTLFVGLGKTMQVNSLHSISTSIFVP